MSLRDIVPLVAMADQKDGGAIDGCDRIIEDIGETPAIRNTAYETLEIFR